MLFCLFLILPFVTLVLGILIMKYDPEYDSYRFSNSEILTILQSLSYSLANDGTLLCAEKDSIKQLSTNLQNSVCVDYCS